MKMRKPDGCIKRVALRAASLALLGSLWMLPAQAEEIIVPEASPTEPIAVTLVQTADTTLEPVALEASPSSTLTPMQLAEGTSCCGTCITPSTITKPFLEVDRTLFSNTPYVVGRDNLMLESGFSFWRFAVPSTTPEVKARQYDFINPSIRYGITDNTEFQITPTNYFMFRGGIETSGFDDTLVSVKHQMPSFAGIDWAIQPGVYIPIGANVISNNSVTPELKLLWARKIYQRYTDRVTLRGRFLGAWSSYGSLADSTLFSPSIALQIRLSNHLHTFVEYLGGFQNAYKDFNVFQQVYTYNFKKNQQFDLHYGGSWIEGSKTKWFIKVGYTFLFHDLFHRNNKG